VTLKLGGGESRKIVSMNLMAKDIVILHILSQLDVLNASGFFSSINEEPNRDLYDMAVVLDEVKPNIMLCFYNYFKYRLLHYF